MGLTTFRKNGQTVTTPVWFAADGNRLVVMTGVSTGKVKRLRGNPKVQVARSSANGKESGPRQDGVVRFLPAPESTQAMHLLDHKYGIQRWMAKLVMRLRREQNVYLEITPAQ
jgi:PPOX class probable F420-dependent enzyme